MPQINRKYPGKNAQEIYDKVDEVMEHLTTKMGLKYETNPDDKTGNGFMVVLGAD